MATSAGLSVKAALMILFQNAAEHVNGMNAAIALDGNSGKIIAAYSMHAKDEQEAYRVLSQPVKDALDRVAREFVTGIGAVSFFDTNSNRLIFLKALNLIFCFILDLESSIENMLPYAYIIAEKIMRVIHARELGDVKIDLSIPAIENIACTKAQLYQVKLVVIGDQSVGKTSIIHRYSQNAFKENFLPTLGVAITTNTVDIVSKNSEVKFAIWDFGGQDYLRRVRLNYYCGAKACFIVFDLTREDSFDALLVWDEEKKQYAGDISTVILGNKADLVEKRQVSRDRVLAFANSRGYSYIETSAKTGSNVNDAFKLIAYQVVEQE